MLPLERRRFDHLALELSLALSLNVPRLALWTAAAPSLSNAAGLAEFCGAPLDAFLAQQRLPTPTEGARARLRREVARFDPRRRTPEETLARLFGGSSGA